MLILSNEEIDSLLTLELALKSLERAYIGQARGTAVNRQRSDLIRTGFDRVGIRCPFTLGWIKGLAVG